jgi:uracil-DNA glycosylase
MQTTKVLFVGSNPSESAKTYEPFDPSSRSRKILDAWTAGASAQFVYVNVYDLPTKNNKPLSVGQIQGSLLTLILKIRSANTDRIVTLGKTADKALKMLNIDHVSLPHPSGRCRTHNDPEALAATKAKIADLISRV